MTVKKSYNVNYTAETKKVSLAETELNNSTSCEEMFPVYSLTVKPNLSAGKTVRVRNSVQSKDLTAGSCVKFKADLFPNYID